MENHGRPRSIPRRAVPRRLNAPRVSAKTVFGVPSVDQPAPAEAWGASATVAAACQLVRQRQRSAGEAAALQLLAQAHARFPGSARLMAEEARLLEALHRWEAAAQAWVRVLDLRPDDAQARVGHLSACIQALPTELGLAELSSLLRVPRFSGEASLHRLLGRLLEHAGRPAEALTAWRAAAALAPHDAVIGAELVFALRRCGRRGEAFAGLLALVAAQPRRLPALAALVADAKALGRVGPARRLLVDLAQRDPDLRHLWGWVHRLGASRPSVGGGSHGR